MQAANSQPTLWERVGRLFGGEAHTRQIRLKAHAAELSEAKANYERRMKDRNNTSYGVNTAQVDRCEYHNVPYTKWADNPTIAVATRPSYDHLLDVERDIRKKENERKLPKELYETHDIWSVVPIPPVGKTTGSSSPSSESSTASPTGGDESYVFLPDPNKTNEENDAEAIHNKAVRTWGPRGPVIRQEVTMNDLHVARTNIWEKRMESLNPPKPQSPTINITANHVLFSDGHYGTPAENLQKGFHIRRDPSPPAPAPLVEVAAPISHSSNQSSEASMHDSTVTESRCTGSKCNDFACNLADSGGEIPEFMSMGHHGFIDTTLTRATAPHKCVAFYFEQEQARLAKKDSSDSDSNPLFSTSSLGLDATHEGSPRALTNAESAFMKITPATSRKSSVSLLSKSLSHGQGMPDKLPKRTKQDCQTQSAHCSRQSDQTNPTRQRGQSKGIQKAGPGNGSSEQSKDNQSAVPGGQTELVDPPVPNDHLEHIECAEGTDLSDSLVVSIGELGPDGYTAEKRRVQSSLENCQVEQQPAFNIKDELTSDSEEDDSDADFDAIDWDAPLTPDAAPIVEAKEEPLAAPQVFEPVQVENLRHVENVRHAVAKDASSDRKALREALLMKALKEAYEERARIDKRKAGAEAARKSFANFERLKKEKEEAEKAIETARNTRGGRKQQRERTRIGHRNYVAPALPDTPVTAHRKAATRPEEPRPYDRLPEVRKLDRKALNEDLARRATSIIWPHVKPLPSGARTRYTTEELAQDRNRNKLWNYGYVQPVDDEWEFAPVGRNVATREPVLFN